MKTAWCLAGSLLLNAVLWLTLPVLRPVTTGDAIASNPELGAPETPAPVISPAPRASLELSPFQWEMLRPDDLHLHVSKLREVGCPERTVRSIVLSELDCVLYEELEQIVRPVQPVYYEELAASRGDIMDFCKPQQAQLEKLVEAYSDRARSVLGQEETRVSTGDRAENDLNFEQLAQSFSAQEIKELRQIETKYAEHSRKHLEGKRLEMLQVVDAEKLKEWELRKSSYVGFVKDLSGFWDGPGELRWIVALHEELQKTITDPKRNREEFERRFIAQLGKERWEAFSIASDEEFRALYHLAVEHGKSSQEAFEMFQILKPAKRYFEDPQQRALTPEMRDRVRIQLADVLCRSLGPKAAEDYFKKASDWIWRDQPVAVTKE